MLSLSGAFFTFLSSFNTTKKWLHLTHFTNRDKLTNVPTCEHGSPQRGHVIVVFLFGGSFPLPLPVDAVVSVSLGGLSLPLPPVGGGGGVGGVLDVSFVDLLCIGLRCTDLCGWCVGTSNCDAAPLLLLYAFKLDAYKRPESRKETKVSWNNHRYLEEITIYKQVCLLILALCAQLNSLSSQIGFAPQKP